MAAKKSHRTYQSYSALSTFRNCRKKFDYRYNQRLKPLDKDANLHYGAIWHQCLERLYLGMHEGLDLDDEQRAHVFAPIDEGYPDYAHDEAHKHARFHLRAMLTAYLERWLEEDADLEVIGVEQGFEAPLAAYAKKRGQVLTQSNKHFMRGKVDAVVRRDNQIWILEHKTASALTGDYIEKLPSDMQIHLYARYLEKAFDYPVTGIIYNIAVKSRIQQAKGETEDEYEARRQELIAKSKTGKTSAKRKMPETDEAFHERLLAKYRDYSMFHREELFIARDDLDLLEEEIAELSLQIRNAERRGRYYKNTDHCFHWNRPCPYLALCRSHDNPLIREKFYVDANANASADESDTAF